MALTTVDGFIAGAKQPVGFGKGAAATIIVEGLGNWHSYWKNVGTTPVGSTPPAYTAGSGYTCDRTTEGAMPFTNATSANQYLANFTVSQQILGYTVLYDRLWTCSGFVTNSVSTQTITTPGTLPAGRDASGGTDGDGVELWLEVYTATGVTGATWTVEYTNSDGTTGRSATYIHPANAETVGQIMPMTLQDGDKGVRSVQSFTCSISSGTAGDVGITLLRRIAGAHVQIAYAGVSTDGFGLGLPRVYDNSCLALMGLCSTTSVGWPSGNYTLVEG